MDSSGSTFPEGDSIRPCRSSRGHAETARKNSSRFIGFIDAGGKSQTLYLGKVPKRYAESVKVKVEDLVCSSITGHAPSDETSRWLAGQDDRMIAKLGRVRLTPDRHHTTLEAWLSKYLKEREGDLKSASLRKLEQTRDKLLTHFDPQMPLHKITGQQAAEWRQHLRDLKLSEAAIKTHCGNVKTITTKAVRPDVGSSESANWGRLSRGIACGRHCGSPVKSNGR